MGPAALALTKPTVEDGKLRQSQKTVELSADHPPPAEESETNKADLRKQADSSSVASCYTNRTLKKARKKSPLRRKKRIKEINPSPAAKKKKKSAVPPTNGDRKKPPLSSMQIPPARAIRMDEDSSDEEFDVQNYESSGRDVMLPAVEESDDRHSSRSWAYYSGTGGDGDERSAHVANYRKRKHLTATASGHYQESREEDQEQYSGGANYIPSNLANGAPMADSHQQNSLEKSHEPAPTEQVGGDATMDFSEDLHRLLVEAIYDIGVSHASPSVIMENMTYIYANEQSLDTSITSAYSDPHVAAVSNQVTSERVKSHLQKYRKNKKKNKDVFRREYSRWAQKALSFTGGISTAARTCLASNPAALIEMMGESSPGDAKTSLAAGKEDLTKKLLGGELAAFLTYSVMLEDENNKVVLQKEIAPPAPKRMKRRASEATAEASLLMLRHGGGNPHATSVSKQQPQQRTLHSAAMEYAQDLSGARLSLPILTEEEKLSSLGVSINHVVGLFHSMSHTLMKERMKDQRQRPSDTEAAEDKPLEGSRANFPERTVDAPTGSGVAAHQYPLEDSRRLHAFFSPPGCGDTNDGRQPKIANASFFQQRLAADSLRYQHQHIHQEQNQYTLQESSNLKEKFNVYYDHPSQRSEGQPADRLHRGP